MITIKQGENTMEKERFDEWFEAHFADWLRAMRGGFRHGDIQQFRDSLLTAWNAALSAARVAGEDQTLVDESELVALRCINDAVQIIGDQASETRNVNWAVVRDAKQRLRATPDPAP